MTHICVSKLTIIGSDNGLSPGQRQTIIWTNAGILLIWPLGTNFSEILIEIQTFSLKKMRLKMSSAKCCPFRLGFNVLNLCSKLNDGSASGMRCRHLISNTTVPHVDDHAYTNHPRIYNLTKIHFGSSPKIVKHPLTDTSTWPHTSRYPCSIHIWYG